LPISRSLSTAAAASGLRIVCRNVVVAVLLVVVGPIVTATTTFLWTIGKPEAAAAVDRLLLIGKRMPETC
jgi:hypothetical protein